MNSSDIGGRQVFIWMEAQAEDFITYREGHDHRKQLSPSFVLPVVNRPKAREVIENPFGPQNV